LNSAFCISLLGCRRRLLTPKTGLGKPSYRRSPHMGIDLSGNRLRRIDVGSSGHAPSLCSQKGVTLLPHGLRTCVEGNDEGGESAEQGGIVEGDEKINVAD
jgi:hypothetical protein